MSLGLSSSLLYSHAVGLISLCEFYESDGSEELVERSKFASRHLASQNDTWFAAFSSVSKSINLASCCILRRYQNVLWEEIAEGLFGARDKQTDTENEEIMTLSKVTANRINRETERTKCMRNLAVNETFRSMNALNTTLLYMANDFEDNRIARFEEYMEGLNAAGSENCQEFDALCKDEITKLQSFLNEKVVARVDGEASAKTALLRLFQEVGREITTSYGDQVS